MSFTELCAVSNFSFLHGASSAEEMVLTAKARGLQGLAIGDINSFAGIVRAHVAAKQHKLPFAVATRLRLRDTPLEFVALPTNRGAYANLCRLLTLGKRRTEKGDCDLKLNDLIDWCTQASSLSELIWLPPDPLEAGLKDQDIQNLKGLINQPALKDHQHLAMVPVYDGRDVDRFAALARFAQTHGLNLIATNAPRMHAASRRRVADVLTCMDLGCKIDEIGRHALPNAEAFLKPPETMALLFKDFPRALTQTQVVMARCRFSLDELRYEYPHEVTPQGVDVNQHLRDLTEQGLKKRYPNGASDKARQLVEHELAIIKKLDYAPYFLTVEDLVGFARDKGILCQGRGSAANSIVCYALGITEVAPELISMVFERFISEARNEPPDIDVDFEHERREEVIQHIYNRFGRHRAGLCATVVHFRSRAALREVGKVMGLSQDVLSQLTAQSWGHRMGDGPTPEQFTEMGLDPNEPRLKLTLELVQELIGFPRHLSQHVGGFIMTRGRLDELCPIENAAMEDRTVIEWDKDDIDALGILKVDVLSLGMLTCLRKGFDLLRQHEHLDFSLASVPQEDKATYDMLCRADSLGVFQVESRAQMSFLPRMKPRCYYDLVIEVAIVRPGPIQGGMVHPYIRRRTGEEAVDYPSDELRQVLEKTLGVPLFQEQAMQIAITAAGFSPTEADQLRRAMATFRKTGTIHSFDKRFIEGMVSRGYPRDFAERCFRQIEGFGEYGFPESHAASFAYLAYVSAWFKCHHPAIFACALLNSQPMGFYAPAQIIRDVREHGVQVLPVCVNASTFDNSIEPDLYGRWALRLGFRQIKGLSEEDANWIAAARGNGYVEPEDLWRRAGLSQSILTRLAEADAFINLDVDRRQALWRVAALKAPKPLPLFANTNSRDQFEGGIEEIMEPEVHFPAMREGEHVVQDYINLRLTLRSHPMELLRPTLKPHGSSLYLCAKDLLTAKDGSWVTVAGLVIARQRPGTAKGVIFMTLEDESGTANIVVWSKVYEENRRTVVNCRLARIYGKLERKGIVTHLITHRIKDKSHLLQDLSLYDKDSSDATPHRFEQDGPVMSENPARRHAFHPREQAKTLFPSRDFH